MKIMNKVTWEYLKKNKRRTIVTILGVIISVAMITAVATFFDTFMDLMRREAINEDGEWHMQFQGVPMAEVPVIKEKGNAAESVLSRPLGWGKLDMISDEDAVNRSIMQFIEIEEFDGDAFGFRHIRLTDGRYPTKSDELLVNADLSKVLGHPIAVGDTLTLPVGQRIFTDGEGAAVQSYYTQEGEAFTDVVSRTYTIVGLIPGGSATGVSRDTMKALSFLDVATLGGSDRVNVAVRAASLPGNFYQRVNEFAGTFTNNRVVFHDSLLRTMGLLPDPGLTNTFLILIVIVGSIILIGSVMLIYNSFAISVSERSRQLGMLASVGATRSQKRNSVLFEGAVIGVFAIPFGLLFGVLGIGITYYLIDPMIQEVLNLGVPMRIKVNFLAMAMAVAFSAVTILISLWVPARKASRITPIEAIRQAQDVTLKGRQVKTSHLTRRVFGFEGELALKNLKRNKRRYRATVLSLTVSILLFLTAAAFTHYINRAFSMTQNELHFDVAVTLDQQLDKENGVVKQISEINGVESWTAMRSLYGNRVVLDANQVTNEVKAIPSGMDLETGFYVNINALDAASLSAYAKEVGIDPKLLNDPDKPRAILQNEVTYKTSYDYTDLKLINGKPGETLPIFHESYDNDGNLLGRYDLPIELAALTNKAPTTMSEIISDVSVLNLFVSEEVLDSLTNSGGTMKQSQIYLALKSTGDAAKLEKDVNDLLANYSGGKYRVNNLEQQLAQSARLGSIVAVFVYGFVALITLISVANTFNTISTSIGLRRREFAMLKSVGMTPKSFNRMIYFESIFYGGKALLYGLPLSFIVMVLEYVGLARNFEFAFSLPWGPILGSVAAIFLIVGTTMLYSISKVKKANIVDALTEENI